jgi:hypothetical protein
MSYLSDTCRPERWKEAHMSVFGSFGCQIASGSFVSWLVTHVIDDFGTLFAEIGIDLMPEALDIIGYRSEDNCCDVGENPC